MRCRECGKAFDGWSWENPVCPECLGQSGMSANNEGKPPLADETSSILSSDTSFDDFSLGDPVLSESVEDILSSSTSTPTFDDPGIGDDPASSLTADIGGDIKIKDDSFMSHIEAPARDTDILRSSSSILGDTSSVWKDDSSVPGDASPAWEESSSLLTDASSGVLGEGMSKSELREIKEQVAEEIFDPLTPDSEEIYEVPIDDKNVFDMESPSEDHFKEEKNLFRELTPEPFAEEIEESANLSDESETEKSFFADNSYEENFEIQSGADGDVLSTEDLLEGDITILSSSQEIPEGIPVAGQYTDGTVEMPFDEPQDIPEAKQFFTEDYDDYHTRQEIDSQRERPFEAAEVAGPGELRSEIQNFVCPGGRYTIDFAEGKFLRMEMTAEGMNGWNMAVVIILLSILVVSGSLSCAFLFVLPFILLFGIKVAIRVFATEKLYVEEQGIRHEVLLVPGFSLRWEKDFTPSIYAFKTTDPFRFFRCRGKSSVRRDDMLFIGGDDWRERVGFLTDEQEARWILSHLHRFLRKVRTIH